MICDEDAGVDVVINVLRFFPVIGVDGMILVSSGVNGTRVPDKTQKQEEYINVAKPHQSPLIPMHKTSSDQSPAHPSAPHVVKHLRVRVVLVCDGFGVTAAAGTGRLTLTLPRVGVATTTLTFSFSS